MNYCKYCRHFCQHYTFDHGKLFRVYCGHCTYSKVKIKQPDSKACQHYVWAAPDEDAFATKEYLSKALLDYVLKMELLPEIRDIEY